MKKRKQLGKSKDSFGSRKSQIKMSFGMIFSILLIIAFLAVAIYAITFFLDLKKCSDMGSFKEELQKGVNRAWESEESREEFKRTLPSGIGKVCFIDIGGGQRGEYSEIYRDVEMRYSDENMIYWPLEKACSGLAAFKIERLNITEITKEENPVCFENDGEVELVIEKKLYSHSVNIK